MDIRENESGEVLLPAGRFIKEEYSNVKLPCRSTTGSAGYDFYYPFSDSETIKPGQSLKFSTNIIADIKPGWVLLLFPRSGLGMKGIRIANTVGVIDSDYKLPIHCKLVNDGEEDITLNYNDRFMQGVFVRYGIAEDEDLVDTERTGGMGSTGK